MTTLATTRGPRGRERVAYADLDVEQLGAVYEQLLEFEPSRTDAALRLTRTSHDRKATGSFYTPRAMTDFLVRRALNPLVADKSSDAILQLRVLDPAMGSGAFLVSACRFLSAALGNAGAGDAGFAAGLLIVGAIKATIGGKDIRSGPEGLLVITQRGLHMVFIGRITVQDAILSD